MTTILRSAAMICLLLGISMAGNSQSLLNKLGKKLKDKIETKAEEQVNEKIDDEVDKQLDDISQEESTTEDANDDARQQERLNKIMQGMGISGEPIAIDDAYSFESKIQMHIETYKGTGEKESDGDFITWTSPSVKNFAYEFVSGDIGQKGKGTFIMDIANRAMIILSEEGGNKTGIVYGFDVDNLSDISNNPDLDETNIETMNMNPYLTKTGRTKNIEGYLCEEYKYDNPEEATTGSFWVSNEVNIATRDMMGTIFKTAAYSHGMPWGFVMESEAINKETNERSLMKVTDIDPQANKRFELDNYQITNLGSMKIPDMSEE